MSTNKIITTINQSDTIDIEQAKSNLVNFILSNKPVTQEDFSTLLTSFYSFCSEKATEMGSVLPEISYITYNNKDTNTIAHASLGIIGFNLAQIDIESSKTMSPKSKIELLETIFHEHSHIMDYNLSSVKHTLTSKPNKYRPHNEFAFDKIFEYLEETEGPVVSKLKKIFKSDKIRKELLDAHFHAYFTSDNEVRARKAGIDFTKEIVETAKNKPNLGLEQQFTAIELGNQFEEIAQFEKLSTKLLSESKMSHRSKKMADKLSVAMLDHISKSSKELLELHRENPNHPLTHSAYNKFEESCFALSTHLHIAYDDKIAQQFFDILTQTSVVNDFDVQLYASLLNPGDFCPTQEQFQTVIDKFKNLTFGGTPAVNPLRSCLDYLVKYDKDLIIECFAKDNPDMAKWLVQFNEFPCTVVISPQEISEIMDRFGLEDPTGKRPDEQLLTELREMSNEFKKTAPSSIPYVSTNLEILKTINQDTPNIKDDTSPSEINFDSESTFDSSTTLQPTFDKPETTTYYSSDYSDSYSPMDYTADQNDNFYHNETSEYTTQTTFDNDFDYGGFDNSSGYSFDNDGYTTDPTTDAFNGMSENFDQWDYTSTDPNYIDDFNPNNPNNPNSQMDTDDGMGFSD